MADRTLNVRISAHVSGFKSQIKAAKDSMDGLGNTARKANAQIGDTRSAESGMKRLTKTIEEQRAEFESVGTVLTGFGAAVTGSLGLAAKAAIDWESAFAGVKKTVDGTDEQMAALSGELRNMARELPASHTEIAAVAEAAGQLGVQRENVASFTKTMIDMGQSTNLSADEAATAIARFANITGTAQSQVHRIGSAIVALGNTSATTEAEIMEMSMRLAAAGAQAGMSEGTILGLSAAMSSIGINAEAGGSAMSRVLIDIGRVVDTGGDKLEILASTAGMTAAQFRRAYEKDAAGALVAFIDGLGKMQKSGQSITPVLDGLKWKSVQMGAVLRGAASNSDLFTRSINTGNDAFKEGVALQNEANQRYSTTASQLAILKNNFTEAAISLGSVFLPVINAVVGPIASLASGFADLPQPLQTVVGLLGAVAGGGALVAGSFMLLAPRVLESVKAFKALKVGQMIAGLLGVSNAANTAGAAFKGLKAVTGFGIALGAVTAAIGYFTQRTAEAAERQKELQGTLDQTTGALTDQTVQMLAGREDLQKSAAAYEKAGGSVQDFWQAVAGDEAAFARVQSLADELNGADSAARQFAQGLSGGPMAQANPVIDGVLESIRGVNEEFGISRQKIEDSNTATETMQATLGLTGDTLEATGEIVDAAGESFDGMGEEIEDAESKLENLIKSYAEFGEINMSADEWTMKYAETLSKVTAELKAGAGASATGTAAQQANQQSLIGLARDASKTTAALFNQKGATVEVAKQQRQAAIDFYNTAIQMGVSADKAAELTHAYGLVPSDVKTKAQFEAWKAMSDTQRLDMLLDQVNGRKTYSQHTHTETVIERFQQIGQSAMGLAKKTLAAAKARGAYATGGYTGPGGIYEPAGIVHKGEVVWSQADIARAGGVAVVEAMRQGLRGYSAGGVVAARSLQKPVVNVASPSLDGLAITGALHVGEALVPIIDGRISRHPGVAAADYLARNHSRIRKTR